MRDRRLLASWLLALVAVLLVANAVRHDWITKSWLTDNKDVIDVVTKLVGCAILVLGAVASYFRFFHGRLFTPKAKLDFEIEVMPASATQNLHAVRISLENIGPVPIWDPVVSLELSEHAAEPRSPRHLRRWYPVEYNRDATPRSSVIDPQEQAIFETVIMVDKSVWAVTYGASVIAVSRDVWHNGKTIANLPGIQSAP